MPESINPATEKRLQAYGEMSPEAVRSIIAEADKAATAWGRRPVDERATAVGRVAGLLESRKGELALAITREMGKPIGEARAEIEKCAWVCRYYAENGPAFLADERVETGNAASYTACRPLGVILGVMPWNFPFWQVFRFAAPNLTAGNGAVLKHASNVTGCALAIESVIRDAGLPDNLFRTLVISSDKVDTIIGDPRVRAATLTGSEAAGRAVAAAAGKHIKKTVLELGGSDPYIILGDADLDKAARLCAASRMINGGQSCIAAKRFIAVETVHDAFLGKLVREMRTFAPGDPEDPETRAGPLARADLRGELHRQVEASVEAGARLELGGSIPEGTGFYYPPTVLSGVTPNIPAGGEETFGPVAAVMRARDPDEAVDIANSTPFGLGSAIFSRDTEAARRLAGRIRAGTCAINDFVKSDPRLPFGGVGNSGYGRELAAVGIREFVNLQTVVVGGA